VPQPPPRNGAGEVTPHDHAEILNHTHDYVVQAKGAFDETVLGVLKLKDRKQRVEIRVVLHALTAPIIAETCRWLARNLPIVDHVALMGLENTGFAIANDAMLWIDPLDYQERLAEGVAALTSAGVRVSIYNLPRCVLLDLFGLNFADFGSCLDVTTNNDLQRGCLPGWTGLEASNTRREPHQGTRNA
jgi:MoaA/NifB/PqqE/SkfB family radical SAM enzyme